MNALLKMAGAALLVAGISAPAVALAQSTAVTAQPASNESKAPPCDRYGLVTVVRCMGHDVLGIGNRDSLLWLGAGGLLAAASHPADDDVLRAFATTEHSTAYVVGDHLGFAGVQFGVPAAAYFISRASVGSARFRSTRCARCAMRDMWSCCKWARCCSRG